MQALRLIRSFRVINIFGGRDRFGSERDFWRLPPQATNGSGDWLLGVRLRTAGAQIESGALRLNEGCLQVFVPLAGEDACGRRRLSESQSVNLPGESYKPPIFAP